MASPYVAVRASDLCRVALIVLFLTITSTIVRAAEPIKIGLAIAQSGQLAANGKSALAGMKIWEEDVNAKGGLLGRPVKLVYYDDQSNPANVPDKSTTDINLRKRSTTPQWQGKPFAWRVSWAELCARSIGENPTK